MVYIFQSKQSDFTFFIKFTQTICKTAFINTSVQFIVQTKNILLNFLFDDDIIKLVL